MVIVVVVDDRPLLMSGVVVDTKYSWNYYYYYGRVLLDGCYYDHPPLRHCYSKVWVAAAIFDYQVLEY